MSAYLQHIETIVPEYSYTQEYARERMKGLIEDPKLKRLAHAIYRRSGIERRHTVYDDFVEGVEGKLFRVDEEGQLHEPTTQERNDLYSHSAKKLAVQLSRNLFEKVEGYAPSDVTHIVFASCTGFCNPGPEYYVIRELGLPQSVERYTIGFMGCYAAFPALRMAKQFCEADPSAVVLVICLELCSLHLQIDDSPDTLLANSLFADGAAATLVTTREPAADKPAFRLDGLSSALIPSGEQEMAWDIGNNGFNIVLSSYVPDVIAANLDDILRDVLLREELRLEDITEWAIHPGGRAILDKVVDSLGLPADSQEAARKVLNDYGNMSSATILFVLKEMLNQPATGGKTFAVAFGPGLAVETAVLQRLGVSVSESSEKPDALASPEEVTDESEEESEAVKPAGV